MPQSTETRPAPRGYNPDIEFAPSLARARAPSCEKAGACRRGAWPRRKAAGFPAAQICENAAGARNRLVICETVSAYCGSLLSLTQAGCTPNAAQFLLCVSRSGLQSM